MDEHHDQLCCPPERKVAWKKLALWASVRHVPIILLSATAPPRFESTLLSRYQLRVGSTAFVRSRTDRPELGFHTVQLEPLLPEEALSHLVQALKGRLKKDEKMLVFFCATALADAFSEKHRCAVFHSRLPKDGNTKSYNLARWDNEEAAVMACSSAFASGVDRPNVRFIVIYNPQYNLMTTMQMAGRAGRDGKESHVFFATPETQGATFRERRNPDMPWELGQLVHEKQCRVYQSTLYMDGAALARKCSASPSQVPCDVCRPDGEMHTFALNAVKNPGRPITGLTASRAGSGLVPVASGSNTRSHSNLRVGGAGGVGGPVASSSKSSYN